MSALGRGYTRLVAAVFIQALVDMQARDEDAARFISLEGGRYLEALGFEGGAELIWKKWKYLQRPSYIRKFSNRINQLLER